MTEPDIRAIMTRVVVEILTDRHLSFPWYQAEIRSEAEAQAASARLPLIYSWNEVVQTGHLRSLTVSVNSARIGQMLACYLPRSHPGFAPARDRLTRLLCDTQSRMLLGLCAESCAWPSQLTARIAR
jgi:hypothetical protein